MAEPVPQDDFNDLQPQHEEPEIPPDPPSPVSQPPRNTPSRRKIYILLLGPSGAGKSLLSNTVCEEQVPVAAPGSGLCTTSFRYQSFILAEKEVRLVDTPGFDASFSNNGDVLYRLVCYLMKLYRERNHKITGIVYLHPGGSDINSNHLKQTIKALKTLIGERSLSQLKVAVVADDNGTIVDTDLIRSLQGPTSPFHAIHGEGAEILGLPLRSENVREFLLGYTHLPYLFLRIQSQATRGSIGPLRAYIERILRPTPTESSSGPLSRSRRSTDRVSRAEVTERSQHLELALAESEAETKLLRDRFEQTQSEYVSLRSELQLNDNTEQSKIVQSLKDLNRCIENFGRSVAEHIVDNYVSPYTDDETTLKASNLPGIKAQFCHQEGGPSLVVSSTGRGMPTEDFFDLSIRFILCKRLYEHIFLPFHPTLAGDSRNEFMNELYQEVRRQDHQTIASKWRANSFLALSKSNDTEIRAQYVHNYIENIRTQDLDVLFSNFFDKKKGVSLADSYEEELEKLVSLAWDWNHVLKGSVVVLGDFQPTIYENGAPFDPGCMVDFEPDRKSKKVPSTALCTIGFGLMASRSKDKGNVLDDVVVCKASVVTEHVYD
ncbi:hypothetical protein FS749_006020 [Ceratobasidium sp. UAMH 11750]|nr:hypothetical protein FS749_006020 [Ceratobasidium sp. UAMH 11750]